MANFTAADVKALRDRTGAGMLDCKNALVEAEGDVEKAIELIRVKGLKGVEKRGGRTTSAGLIAAQAAEGYATMIELASETDFVAKNDTFVALAQKVLDAVTAARAADAIEGNAARADAQTVSELIAEESAVLAEKIELRRVATVTGENFAIYLHKTSKDLPPQVGVVVGYTGSDAETARSIAQHIAFADPHYISRDDVPAAEVEKERGIIIEIAKNEGKPEAALPKIIEGRLSGYFKQVALLDQDYAKDNKFSVGRIAADANLVISGFSRFKVGA
ncbi:MAG: translation elongation factor Ts [Microbacteriaceae bacterium]